MAKIRVKTRVSPGPVRVNKAAVAAFIRTDPDIQRDMARRASNMITGWRQDVPPGELASTFRIQPGSSGAVSGVTAVAGVEGETPQLGYFMYGTRPHEIVPRIKKALRFVGRRGVTFAKRVQHPGNRPHPFMENNVHRAAD